MVQGVWVSYAIDLRYMLPTFLSNQSGGRAEEREYAISTLTVIIRRILAGAYLPVCLPACLRGLGAKKRMVWFHFGTVSHECFFSDSRAVPCVCVVRRIYVVRSSTPV